MSAQHALGRRFVVEGRGEFPVDMLRYDSACFDTQGDVDAAGEGYVSGKRRVALRSSAPMRPTTARWQSFGWQVVEADLRIPARRMPAAYQASEAVAKAKGPRAKTEPLREAIKLCDAAVKWAEGGGKVSAAELRAIRAAIAKAAGSAS